MKKLMLLILMLGYAGRLLANSQSDFAMSQYIERRITNEVTEIVHGFDPNAIVIVRVTSAAIKDVELPGTPFEINETTIVRDDGVTAVGSVQVSILGNRSKITQEAIDLIAMVATVDKVKPNVLFRPLPKGFVSPNQKDKQELDDTENTKSPATTTDLSSEKKEQTPTLAEQMTEAAKAVSGLFESKAASLGRKTKNALVATAIAIAVVIVGLIYLAFNFSSQLGKIAQAIASAATSARTASSEPAEISRPRKQSDESTTHSAANRNSGSASSDEIRTLPFEALLELIGDCYWGQYDGYAKHLWSRASVDTRKQLIASSPQLANYVSALNDVPEVDLGAHADPVYLRGMKISHLDNYTLAELVRRQPTLFSVFSRLRIESMGFSIEEWIEFSKNSGPASETVPDFSYFPASDAREIKMRHKFARITRKDEEAILVMRDVATEIIEGARSLAWIMSVAADPLKEILKGFTALDLAEALDAPKAAIDYVLAQLPDKKRQLTTEYLQKGVANRQSESFDALYNAMLDHLRQVEYQRSKVKDAQTASSDQVEPAGDLQTTDDLSSDRALTSEQKSEDSVSDELAETTSTEQKENDDDDDKKGGGDVGAA
jgi:hypothetical protein